MVAKQTHSHAATRGTAASGESDIVFDPSQAEGAA